MNQTQGADITQLNIQGELYYKIRNVDSMRPFFMSIVSDSNHWLFISSNGGLTAGRKNSEFALFPYYTDDKIIESAEFTGSKTLVRVKTESETYLWEPFSIRNESVFDTERNIYKSQYGNKLMFEEINNSLGLGFKYEWCSSNLYGFVRKSKIENISSNAVGVEIIDGIQNVLPASVPSDLQNAASNLVDAYKRSELHKESGLGIFALSAIIVDRAEPSEALKANIVWSLGMENADHLLCAKQLAEFRAGRTVSAENDIKAEKGAYMLNSSFYLEGGADKNWMIIADVNQSHSKVIGRIHEIRSDRDLESKLISDIEAGTRNLVKLNASADGIQLSNDVLRDSRHFANVLFNNMRGGIFDHNYTIEAWDFKKYILNANKELSQSFASFLDELDDEFTVQQLRTKLNSLADENFIRLAMEYLPLKFSRRHGDPSRPWNKFSINMVDEKDGSKVLDYEGNWRDIFQNWEAMVHAYPDFIEGMIMRFLNASTFDGYNPYRVTKGGFDWEVIEEDDPWSYIGYWGDHQIIYLLKFLEFIEKHNPGKLYDYFDKDVFVYANVPYRIKNYKEILKDPKDTVEFDHKADADIRAYVNELGADGAILKDETGAIHRVNFIEKILASLLAKMSNFIPEAGIWMNTQRPEWNDANNALVGNGVSMVTLYYMRRFFLYFKSILEKAEHESFSLSNELMDFYKLVRKVLEDNSELTRGPISDKNRRVLMDGLGTAASDYRNHIYEKSFWGKKRSISRAGLLSFVEISLSFIDHSIAANKRQDGLYHAYNLIDISEDSAAVSYLNEMLEGQVAVLSSSYLDAKASLELLDALKNSKLFREDQYSYILYPNKKLPGFLQKNILPESSAQTSPLIKKLLEDGNSDVIEKDVLGQLHFNGNFRNAADLSEALYQLPDNYKDLVSSEINSLESIFESVFNHKEFTGRSGTFYGYEGLGSIYWHMVSKLLLAVQETCMYAIMNGATDETVGKLLEHFYEINEGIGVHKSPELYGAFPTDPYSHTPGGKGAQQPGMTGQVKEDILSRFGELGVLVDNAQVIFNPVLLRRSEFLEESMSFEYYNTDGELKSIGLEAGSLAFTYCQVPIVYTMNSVSSISVSFINGDNKEIEGMGLGRELSKSLFSRAGEIQSIHVHIDNSILK